MRDELFHGYLRDFFDHDAGPWDLVTSQLLIHTSRPTPRRAKL